MEKEETYTFRLDAELKAAFNQACKQIDVPASQSLRNLMKQFIANVEASRPQPKGKKNGR